jgi:hypothetical protein
MLKQGIGYVVTKRKRKKKVQSPGRRKLRVGHVPKLERHREQCLERRACLQLGTRCSKHVERATDLGCLLAKL